MPYFDNSHWYYGGATMKGLLVDSNNIKFKDNDGEQSLHESMEDGYIQLN